ncbi:MAG TPA: serine/threonine-protein kinase [Polyangiaceae bacterium]|nr:serine/threonine-protein kinase [Polyangiaceae bacterium]
MPELRPTSTPASQRSPSTGVEAAASSGPATIHNPRSCPHCGGRYPADFKVCPKDATPLEDAPSDIDDPVVGQVLSGTYEVLRVIGEGGMGRVYEARHSRLGKKRFAIKMLHHELARQAEVVTRFQREAEAASALSHPNVVTVFDVNTAPDGRPYIVAELLEGEQLGEHLERRGKLPVREAVSIVRQICRALERAHDLRIIHRDVKPENVFLVSGLSEVKVIDFGISKVSDGTATLTKAGMVMGTPDYMAPEQARGDTVDARADVYAVGAILYRAVTGRKPFEGLDPMATLTAAMVQEPPRPSTLEPSIPLSLELVIQHAMAKKANERFQSMVELDRALEAFDVPDAAPPTERKASVDASGKTILSAAERSETSQAIAERSGDRARLARPSLSFFTGLGFIWLVVNVIVAGSAVLRLLQGSVSGSEIVVILAAALAAAATPFAIWVRFVAREVWPSTPKSLEMGDRLRRTVLFSATAYGLAALFVQIFETAGKAAQGPGPISDPHWALMQFSVALVTALITWFVGTPRRR